MYSIQCMPTVSPPPVACTPLKPTGAHLPKGPNWITWQRPQVIKCHSNSSDAMVMLIVQVKIKTHWTFWATGVPQRHVEKLNYKGIRRDMYVQRMWRICFALNAVSETWLDISCIQANTLSTKGPVCHGRAQGNASPRKPAKVIEYTLYTHIRPPPPKRTYKIHNKQLKGFTFIRGLKHDPPWLPPKNTCFPSSKAS